MNLAKDSELSQGCVDPTSPNLATTIIAALHLHFCLRVRILCCIFKLGQLKV